MISYLKVPFSPDAVLSGGHMGRIPVPSVLSGKTCLLDKPYSDLSRRAAGHEFSSVFKYVFIFIYVYVCVPV